MVLQDKVQVLNQQTLQEHLQIQKIYKMINRDGTQKLLKIALFTGVTLIVLLYIYTASKDYLNGPRINLTYPENGSTIATSTVIIKGQVLHIQDVTINGRPIQIDTQGNFTEPLLLFPGYNVAVISAKDRFKRITEYKLELVYQDKN